LSSWSVKTGSAAEGALRRIMAIIEITRRLFILTNSTRCMMRYCMPCYDMPRNNLQCSSAWACRFLNFKNMWWPLLIFLWYCIDVW
jgi:hypothetical protein